MPPEQKRKRVLSPIPHSDDQKSLGKVPLTKSSDIYFEDGNIVLVAEEVAFRVHKSVVACHSEIFRGVFSIEDHPVDAEDFDGCPVVRLSDQKSEIRDFLLALYGFNPFLRPNELVILNVLTISTKYLADSLRLSAISALRQFYPDTLSEWDRNAMERTSPQAVLKQSNADIALPAAYYKLCQYSPDVVLGDFPLPSPIFATYCLGKTVLATKLAGFVQREIVDEGSRRSVANHGLRGCVDAWKLFEAHIHSFLRDVNLITNPDPLSSLLSLGQKAVSFKVCHACRLKLSNAIEKERKAIWDSLPHIFRLRVGTWKELREMA